MSAIASVVDGKITNQTNVTEKTTASAKDGSNLDKDAFLQLLVAQMKYQDPLEPTSNTEYISQLATFSELEEMQNVSATMEKSRASSLVGEYVFMNVTDSSGVTTYPEGVVDYVVFQGGKTYLSINEQLYNLDDLDTVADSEYLLAVRLVESFNEELGKLPAPELIKESDLEDIETLIEVYNNMSSYQQSYLTDETIETFKEYLEVYKVMTADKEESEPETEESESDNTDAEVDAE